MSLYLPITLKDIKYIRVSFQNMQNFSDLQKQQIKMYFDLKAVASSTEDETK